VTEPIRVGTRGSKLARTQTGIVLASLARATPGTRFDPVEITTSGDRSVGSSPDFTGAIDRALVGGEVDLAVHSAKDLPLQLDQGLKLVACPRRADPRDCLIVAPHLAAGRLPRGSRVGSSSLRRRAQLLRWRPDLKIVEIRGNVDTRIGLVRSGSIDAVILAVAGVSRLNKTTLIDRILPATTFLPAPAQGALAVVARGDDTSLASLARKVNHVPTRACVEAERGFASALGGDCQTPLGALGSVRSGTISLVGEVLALDGRRSFRSRARGTVTRAELLGRRLGKEMLDRGAVELWSPARR
jgi:hydroxymethylbilane synthase